MAGQDIYPITGSGDPIQHGLIVVNTGGGFKTNNDHVINTPPIGEIDMKYVNRLDDPRYYTGDTSA